MEIAIPLFYLLIILTFVYKSAYFKTSTLTAGTLTVFMFIKAMAGLSYWWLQYSASIFQDTSRFIAEGNVVYSSIADNPKYFLELVFGKNDYLPEPEYLCRYINQMGFWYDQSNYTMVRINALIRLFSFGFSSVNFIVFSFLSFIGSVHLFKFLEKRTSLNELFLAGIIFLTPGIVFWTSGAHKEGIVIFLLGIIINRFGEILDNKGNTVKWVLIFILLFLLGLIRFYTMCVVIPGMIAYYLSYKTTIKPFMIFSMMYGFFFLSAVFFDINSDGFRFAEEISIRQQTFLKSVGDTSFHMTAINNSWTNILKLLPEAFVNPFIRPLPMSCRSFLCSVASVESVIYTAIFLFLTYKMRWRQLQFNREALLFISIGLCLMLLIGIIVNNSGAIVRYRSVGILLLFTGMVISIYSPVYKKEKMT